ncbi:MAG: glycosyltransferase [Rubrivivax sp.]|nr:glycosyltransferase [Rubrivivax sp.]
MIAYHFPPLAGSSGIQRTLRFVQHLPALGWQPIVLTADPRAYERTSPDLDAEVPAEAVVTRAFALDTARHLSIAGRYPSWLATPDRWASWRFDGVRRGMALVRRWQPSAIWSTFPIATAHVIASELQRRSGLPWIADFRDPMAQDDYPADPRLRTRWHAIESEVAARATHLVLTTPSATHQYRARYAHAAERIHLIENGYDEESFSASPVTAAARPPNGTLTLLHSGIVYPSERDPTQLMRALRMLHDEGELRPGRLKIRFRASAADALLRDLADAHGVTPYVELGPPLPYREALAEMQRADMLLVMQAANCDAQIPAKLYEYLRAGRPIVALAHPPGDTAQTLRSSGIDAIADLGDAVQIAKLLRAIIGPESGRPRMLADAAAVAAASRRGRTAQLQRLLETLSLPVAAPLPG